jgi:hypothetical protein
MDSSLLAYVTAQSLVVDTGPLFFSVHHGITLSACVLAIGWRNRHRLTVRRRPVAVDVTPDLWDMPFPNHLSARP